MKELYGRLLSRNLRCILFIAGLCSTFQANAQSITWYRDADGDGWGIPTTTTTTAVSATTPSGYVLNNLDCNDAVSNSTVWNGLGTAISEYSADWSVVKIGPDGTPYVAFNDNSTKGSVMTYTDGTWSYLGAQKFTAGQAEYISMTIDHSGNPIMAYRDNGYQASVMQYDGSGWVNVGAAPFTPGGALYTSLVTDALDNPYVAFRDEYWMAGGKASVMMYDGAAWVNVGPMGFSAGTVTYTSLGIDGNDNLYLAFADGANSNKATVMMYDGSTWSILGSAGISTGAATYVSLAVDTTGAPYVAYADAGNSNKVTVKKYNGSSWVNVGSAGFSAGAATHLSLAVDNAKNPIVVYSDGANSNKATVMRYNGSTWVNVVAAGISAGTATYTSIGLSDYGVPYIAYKDGSSSNRLSVKNLQPVVNFPTIPTVSASSSILCSAASVTLTASGTLNDATAWKWYTGSCGGTLVGTGNSITPTISSTTRYFVRGENICASSNGSCGFITVTFKSPTPTWYRDADGDGWGSQTTTTTSCTQPVGYVGNNLDCTDASVTSTVYTTLSNNPVNTNNNSWASVAVDPTNNTPYVAFYESFSRGSVMKYVAGNWSYVGSAQFTAGATQYNSLAVDANSNLYMAYQDAYSGVSVMGNDGDGGAWYQVGDPNFSDAGASYISLALDPSNIPYVVYKDAYYMYSNKATVKAYNSLDDVWEYVGAPGFTSGTADYTAIAIDGAGVPFVAFSDGSNSGKITVMRYLTGGWAVVGSAGFSAGAASYIDIKINSSGTPYVVYKDAGSGNKATVMRYNGSAWVNVGSAGFTSGTADYTSLAVSGTEVFVSYSDGANSGKATVMRFNGTSWAIHSAAISAGTSTYNSIALDNRGIPITAYQDGGASSRIYVEKAGPTATQPTTPTISASSTSLSCGASSTLTASGTLNSAGAWYWYANACGGTGTFVGTGNSIVVTPTVTTTYYAMGDGGCLTTPGNCGSRLITVLSTLPTVNATSGPSSVCQGSTITLTNTTVGGVWSSSSTARATVNSSGLVTGISSGGGGTATISYTVTNSCGSVSALKTVTIGALPGTISGTMSVCTGLTTALSSSSNGPWTSGNTGVATVTGTGTTGTVTGVAAGTSIITHTRSSSGCIRTAIVTVNTSPSAISGASSVCVGSTITLTNTLPSGTWTSSSTGRATVGAATGIVTGVASGAVTISYTAPGGACRATKAISVLSNVANITGTTSICAGIVVSLTSSGNGPWSSSNTGVATVSGSSSTGTVTGVSVGTSTITHTLTSTGCYRTTTVTVNSSPSSISGGTSVCLGSSITLSSTPSGGTWTSSNTSDATIGASTGVVTTVSTGSPTIRYTAPGGCYVEQVLTVVSAPNIITGTLSMCLGSGTSLSSSGTGPWISSNGSVATVTGTGSTGTVSSVGVGTAIITHTQTSTGCSRTAVVTVNPLPSAITGITLICLDGGSVLSSTPSGGTWTSSSNSRATIGASTGIVTAVNNGNTTISYTLSTGCRVTTVVTIANTNGDISGTLSACDEGGTTLTSSGSGTWSSSNTGVATIGATTGVVSGVAAGTTNITHTVTSSGCMTVEQYTVNPLPADIAGTTVLCMTGSTTLTNATGGGTWSSSNVLRATVGSTTGVVTPVSTGTALISYTLSSTGCRKTTQVTVNAQPSVSGISNNGPICAGTTLTLSSSGPANVAGYLWTGPVAITGSTAASASVPSASTAATGVYSLTVNNGVESGCSRTYTTSATVKTLPIATPTNNGPICPGGTATLSANPSGGANTYVWTGANLSSTTLQNPTATPTITSTYSLTVSDGSGNPGCSPSTIYTTVVTRTTTPTAAPTNNGPVCGGAAVTLSANPGGSTNTYTWSGPNLSSATVQNPTATPTTTSTYSLTVSFNSGLPGCSPSTIYTTTVTAYADNRWLGTTSTNWFTASNWCGGVPNTTKNVVIPSGVTFMPLIASGTASVKDITLNATTTLNVTGGTLQISGTPASSGTFSVSGGTIEMNGAAPQTIPANLFSGNTINNLTLSNAAGLTLGGTLNIRGIVTASTGNIAAGGFLTLLSTATQTALISGAGSGGVTGNTIVQRYLPKSYGYKYISSPVTSATVGNMSSYIDLGATFPRFYAYDENLVTAGWVNYTTTTNALTVQKGFAANFGSSTSPVTFQLTGVVNNGAISTTIYNRNRTYTLGFNLMGNPYPSPIDWNASSGWTKTNIDNAIYYFDASDTNMYTGIYSSYVGGVSSNGIANNIIPAMQGFFVHVSNGSYPVTGSLGMTNSVRVNNLNPAYHKPTATLPLVRLEAGYTFTTFSDPVALYFNDDANGAFNKETDALKLMNTDSTVPNLYAVSKDEIKLSIQSIKTTQDNTDVIPLGLQTPADGTVKFGVRSFENIPADINVFFYDAHTKHLSDLRTEPSYNTSIGKAIYENRFFLLFTKKSKADLGNLSGAVNIYSSGASVFVYSLADECELTITDVTGRTIGSRKLVGTGLHEMKLSVASGIYLATVNSAAGRNSVKLFIGNE